MSGRRSPNVPRRPWRLLRCAESGSVRLNPVGAVERMRTARKAQAAQFAANAIAEQLNAWKFATADGDQLLSARFGAATTLLRRRLLRLALAARTSHHRRTLSSRSVGVVASKYGRYRCAEKSQDRK